MRYPVFVSIEILVHIQSEPTVPIPIQTNVLVATIDAFGGERESKHSVHILLGLLLLTDLT